MNDTEWLAINADDGQLLIRTGLVACFLHRKADHELDVRLIDGSSIEMGIVDDDTFMALVAAISVKDEQK